MPEQESEIWDYDELRVNDEGMVEGSAHTRRTSGGETVTATVISYTYDDGEEVNHVPHVVVSDESGSILGEPHGHDSENPRTAIERAKNTAESAFKRWD